MAIWGRITSLVGAGAVGAAARDAVEPELTPLAQTAWKNAPHKVLDPATAAALRARQPEGDTDGIALQGVNLADDAARSGVGSNRFDLLTELARTEPGVAQLIELRRRGLATDDRDGIPHAEFRLLMRRQGYEAGWITEVEQLLQVRLNPAQIALGVVRSLLDSHGLLVGENNTTGGKIAPTPASPIDPRTEALENGVDNERLRVLINSIGLPMALDAAAQSVFRGLIDLPDFYLAVAQGDTRPAWADAILEHARQIPSVSDYVNAHIRGWIDTDAMHRGAARHGMSAADVDLLYLRTGRPAAPGQMATAAARGIDGPDGVPMDRAQFLKGIAESDIRPEWGPMLWESIWLYPALFQLNRLVEAGAIDTDTAVDWAKKGRQAPEVREKLRAYWDSLGGSTTGAYVKKAQTQFWTTTHRSYVAGEMNDSEADDNLKVLDVSAADRASVLQLWKYERDTTRKQLTPTQVKKAFAKLVTNPATAKAWTRQDAIDALLARGFSFNDAETFLDTP